MSQLTPLISDLALILICAGIMTLIFKKLKQPLVLGYIVAGFICTPHFKFTPSVVDSASIHIWSEIGVIFLLFALGLEFSFKKLMKVGGSAVISACTIIFCMILVGVFVGWTFGGIVWIVSIWVVCLPCHLPLLSIRHLMIWDSGSNVLLVWF